MLRLVHNVSWDLKGSRGWRGWGASFKRGLGSLILIFKAFLRPTPASPSPLRSPRRVEKRTAQALESAAQVQSRPPPLVSGVTLGQLLRLSGPRCPPLFKGETQQLLHRAATGIDEIIPQRARDSAWRVAAAQ